MPEQISLKLCLLTSLIEKSEEEAENEASVSNPKNDRDSADKQSPISAGTPTRSESEEV